MKTSFKIIVKLILLLFFFFISPLIQGIKATVQEFNFNLVIFNQNENINPIEIKAFNVMDMVKKEDIPYREIDIEKQEEVKPITILPKDKKSIYIYSTHQKERYKDGKTVIDGSKFLAELLMDLGYDVIVEDRNFTKELNDQGLSYDQSYLISRSAINDALIEYKGFDLLIDFHRDSLPRNLSYHENNGTKYAKMMIVLGGLSSHFTSIRENAMSLTDKTNQLENGIMKNILVRESYYNQDMSDNMLLIEVGSDQNYYVEVKNSIQILAKAIDEIMR